MEKIEYKSRTSLAKLYPYLLYLNPPESLSDEGDRVCSLPYQSQDEVTDGAIYNWEPFSAETFFTEVESSHYIDHRDQSVEETEFSRLLRIQNRRVRFFVKFFKTRGRRDMERWISRSGRYLPLVKRIVKASGLPEEIAYLPLIESGFYPKAYSKAGAVGMWQFMEGTARKYGLRIDWWIDERRDPEKSTYAAARYLKDLYETFGSWPLVLAAYNAGEGRVMRAIKRYKTDDYWKLINKRSFNRETRNYVPKFIALVNIAKNPEVYGFNNVRYKSPLTFEKVLLPDATDLKVIARVVGVSMREIVGLNPQLKRWFSPPNYHNYEIRIPYGKKEVFIKNFSKIPRSERLVFHRHRVRYGETLYQIARSYKTSIKAIAYLNKISNPRRLRANSHIVVPVRASNSRVYIASYKSRERRIRNSFQRTLYTVRKGDTLWDIARDFGVDVAMLYQWNNLRNEPVIYPGDRIVIPALRD